MESSRQEHWSELPFPPPEALPNPGIELRSLAMQADSLPHEPPGKMLNINKLKEKKEFLTYSLTTSKLWV